MLCIAGKNRIAVDVLSSAMASGFDACVLPAREDDWQPSLSQAALDHGVPIVTEADLYGIADLVFLSLEYDKLIKPDRFASDRLYNVHFSLLPKYRGCAPAYWAILNGETEHGVTLHEIDAGCDTGAIIDQRAFSIEGMTSYDIYLACMASGAEMAIEWLDRLMEGPVRGAPQTGPSSSYRRGEADFTPAVDPADPALVRKLRALTFPPYQRPTLDGRDVVGWTVRPGGVELRF